MILTRCLIETLESRTLLSSAPFEVGAGTAVLDPGFGTGGYLAGYGNVDYVQSDGKIIAHHLDDATDERVRLNPDGTIDKTFNPATYVAPLPGLVQSNGKRITTDYLASGISFTRYNTDGSVDKTFGVNGHIVAADLLQTPTRGPIFDGSDSGAKGFADFIPTGIALQGDNIIVAGNVKATVAGSAYDYYAPAIQRLTANGKIDSAFGLVADQSSEAGYEGVIYASSVVVGGNQIVVLADAPEFGGERLYFDAQGNLVGGDSSGVEPFETAVGPDRTINNLDFGAYASAYEFPQFTQYTPAATTSFTISLNHGPDGAFDGGKVLPGSVDTQADGGAIVSVADVREDANQIPYILRFLPLHTGPTGDVSGFLYNDANSNGKRDANEAPLRYWQAYADLNNNGVFDLGEPTAYADYNGYYRIRGLAPGKYVIREVRQAGWRRTSPAGDWPLGSYTVNVTANHVVTANDFGNTTLGLITGTAFYDQNQNHKLDAADHGQAGWTVFLDSNNNGKLDPGEKSTTTDSHGNYSFAVPIGLYHIRVVLKAGYHFTMPTPVVYLVTLASGEVKTGEIFGDH